MVDVRVPTPQLDVSRAPQSEVSGAVFARPNIGTGLEELGQGGEQLADSLARQQAQQDVAKSAVTLDANGVPQMAGEHNSIILGQAGADYQQAWAAGERARLNSAVSNQMEAIRQQHEGDPAAFLTAANTYAASLRDTSYGPQVGNALADQAQQEAAQHHANMQEQMFRLGTQTALSGITTNIADTQNKMRVIARQGGIDTPEYGQLKDQLSTSYQSLKDNKLFGYAPERADSELAQSLSMDRGESVVGNVDSVFKKTSGDGGRAGAQKYLTDQILNNPDLNLSEPERRQLYTYGMAHLEYLTSDAKAAIDANRTNVEKLISSLNAHQQVDPSVINQAMTQAQSLGDSESAMKIAAYAAQSQKAAPYAGLNDEQKLQAMAGGAGGAVGSEKAALDYFTSKGWSPAQASGIVGNLLRESGLKTGANNPGDGSDGSDSIGIGQWNSQRAANLKAFAAQQGKPVTDFQTQLAFVQHELETSEGNAATMLKGAATPQQAAAAFALGYERPKGFMTGDINQVAGGADRVNNAVRLAGGNASSAPIFGGAMASRSAPTPAQMQANPFTMTAYLDSLKNEQDVKTAKAVGDAMAIQLGQGNLPQATTMAAFQQVAERHPDQLGELNQKVSNLAVGAGAGNAAAAAGPAAGQAFLQQVDALKKSGGADLMTLSRAEAAQKIYEKSVANLKTDPYGEATNRGWIARPPPLDFSQPQAIPQAIAERAQAAQALASHTGVAAQPMFSPAEMPMIKSVMTSGTVDQRTALVAAIGGSGATEAIQKATLGKLAGDSATLPLAVAGTVFHDSPETARAIVQGQAILQAEPKYAPKKEAMAPELATVLPHNDLPAVEARDGIGQAARAMYAKLSADANDTTGVVNDDRMRAAIDAVTGGVRSYRGSSIVAPWYGASQSDTDAAVRALTPADVASARTADGKPFPVDMLKPSWANTLTFNNWRMQSVGDGKYLVFSGSDQARQYLGDGQGGKFVLDLGAKRAQVARESAGTASTTPFANLPFATLPVGGPM